MLQELAFDPDEVHRLPPEKKPKIIGDEAEADEEKEESEEEKKRKRKEKILRESWDSADFEHLEISDSGEVYCSDDEFSVLTSDADEILYHQQLERTQGYDVDYFPGTHPFWIQPIFNPEGDFDEDAMKAVDVYNQDKKAKVKFCKVVKANSSFSYYAPTYITFEATDDNDGEVKTYQARVSSRVNPGGPIVEEVRLKPCAV